MKKVKKILMLAIVSLLIISGCDKNEITTDIEIGKENYKKQYDAFIKNVSSNYAYDIAYELSTNENFFNSKMGGRNAGSDAEHKAAEYLIEKMNEIGLSNVEKTAAKCDSWQFNGASFEVDGKNYPVYSYASAGTDEKGITAELVYLNKGTMQDYEGQDVKGKIVLIDIDQREDWWITYPMLEANLHGAAAIIAANVGGYAQISGDALNCQDLCGPVTIPTLSISRNDFNRIAR